METGEAAIRNVLNNPSWFRDNPHYWATASLPWAYAEACVEVVSRKSEKAGAIYQQIIEAWAKPGVKTVYDGIYSLVPDADKEKAGMTKKCRVGETHRLIYL